jgi:hypothetical protein
MEYGEPFQQNNLLHTHFLNNYRHLPFLFENTIFFLLNSDFTKTSQIHIGHLKKTLYISCFQACVTKISKPTKYQQETKYHRRLQSQDEKQRSALR